MTRSARAARDTITFLIALLVAVGLLSAATGTITAADAAPAHRAAAANPVHVAQGAHTALRRDRDCSDFANQAAAQHYFIALGGPQSDPDRLDADGDGIACESNPCPCDHSTGGGGGGGGGHHSAPPPTLRQKARITRVVDGDTVHVRLASGRHASVRLIGIDTPEVYGGVQCWGPQASRAAKKMLPRGTRVTLVSDPTQDVKDRYGRLLRYVQKGSLDVGRRQLWLGNARVYVYNHHPFKRTRLYKSVSAHAKRHHDGLWGGC